MSHARASLSSRWFLGVLLFAAAFWMLDLVWLGAGVPHPLDDTWEDAVVARLLLQGDWFRSHAIYPPLWGLRDPQTLTVPVLVHGPLLPLLLAAPIRIFGPAVADSIAWLAALFALLTLIPLFRLTARLFGEPVAAAAAGLFTVSPLTIAAVNHYGSVVLGALLLTATLDLLARPRPRAGLAGLAAGLGYLVRPEMLIAAPVLALLAAGPRPDRRAARDFLLVFAACASWWWWHHWKTSGSPFFNLTSYLLVSFWPPHPGDGLVRDFGVTPERFRGILAESLPGLWHKWLHFFPRAARRALLTPGESTGWLVPIGALVALGRAELRRFALCAAALALIPVAAMTALVAIWLYPVPFLPLYCVAAALGAKWLLERLPRWAHRPRAWIGLLALAALPAAGVQLRAQADEARMIGRWLALDRAGLAAAVRTEENATRPMFSDTPDFVAWTTGRPTLWLTREEFDRLYGLGGARNPLPEGLPARPDPADTWFHRGNPRDPAGQRGAPIGAEAGRPGTPSR
jgi:hypothetical protein